MYVIDPTIKADPARQWALPDRVFFAAGACQVLAYAALRRYSPLGFKSYWVRPAPGYRGNHIVIHNHENAFDYHGWSHLDGLLAHMRRKARRWWPGWTCELVEIDPEALISEQKSAALGCRMREPDRFLNDAMPRAEAFVAARPWPRV